ncbi:MAG: Hsp70 family protein, partial [Acidimicrobiales bacterium]
MSWSLGVDLGTTYTAAAVNRGGRVTILTLDHRSTAMPSVAFVDESGSVLVGDAADRRALFEPERVAREFKRRLGDTTPLFLAGQPHSPQSLMARILAWVVQGASREEGGAPERIVLTHPANWGRYKTDLLLDAVKLAGVEAPVELISEPEAAAQWYAHLDRIPDGAVVAVYDLGGGTFDAALLRRHGNAFRVVGEPMGIEHLGGMDFDEAVFRHVAASLAAAVLDVDPDDAAAVGAVARLRRDCSAAKDALSSDTAVTIPVVLPQATNQVRILRAEFEAMIGPAIDQTILVLQQTIASAGLTPGELDRVLLVGGSSRIPLIAQRVGAATGRPVAVDTHAKQCVALGAALLAAPAAAAPAAAAPAPAAPAEAA